MSAQKKSGSTFSDLVMRSHQTLVARLCGSEQLAFQPPAQQAMAHE